MSIPTVLGPLDPSSVQGPVLSHEHMVLDLRTDRDSQAVLGLAHHRTVTAELATARQSYGLALVVDQTCRGMGREVNQLAMISRESDVPIIASTGWYYERFHPAGEPGQDLDRAIDVLVAELTEGVTGTGIRPGVIGEVGTHGVQPTPAERVSLLAAGAAAKRTGRPIATHAHLGTGALAQLDVLSEAAAPLSRVCIGHQDLIDDPGQHLEIAARGAYLAFDTVGKESYQSDALRVQMIVGLLEHGLGPHLMLSNDISRHTYLVAEGGRGYGHVLGSFAARLRAAGVDEETLADLYGGNALRWLTGSTDIATVAAPTSPGEDA